VARVDLIVRCSGYWADHTAVSKGARRAWAEALVESANRIGALRVIPEPQAG
jgi:hypothetical protein